MSGKWIGTVPPPPHTCKLPDAAQEPMWRVGHVWACDCGQKQWVLRGLDDQREGYFQRWEPWDDGSIAKYAGDTP